MRLSKLGTQKTNCEPSSTRIPGFVCTLSAAGEVELVNRQVLEYFGKTMEELKNWATSNVVHPDDLPCVVESWKHSIETGQPYDLELASGRADGVYRWFQSRALPTRDTRAVSPAGTCC